MEPQFEQFSDCRKGCFRRPCPWAVKVSSVPSVAPSVNKDKMLRQSTVSEPFLDGDGGVKTVRAPDQHIGRTGMQPLGVDDDDLFLKWYRGVLRILVHVFTRGPGDGGILNDNAPEGNPSGGFELRIGRRRCWLARLLGGRGESAVAGVRLRHEMADEPSRRRIGCRRLLEAVVGCRRPFCSV